MSRTRTGTRSPSFSFNRVTTHVRIRSQLKPIQTKLTSNSIQIYQKTDFDDDGEVVSVHGAKHGSVLGRKIMVVIHSSLEAKVALQWALSHTVQTQDTIVLLYVTKPSKKLESNMEISPRVYEYIYSLKKMCSMKIPEIEVIVEVALVEGKDTGLVIVEEAKKQGVSLLVLGKTKHSMMWNLLTMCTRRRIGGGLVDYCIKNADCMTIAVRRKGRKLGGYLITTKRHRDFWLLA